MKQKVFEADFFFFASWLTKAGYYKNVDLKFLPYGKIHKEYVMLVLFFS